MYDENYDALRRIQGGDNSSPPKKVVEKRGRYILLCVWAILMTYLGNLRAEQDTGGESALWYAMCCLTTALATWAALKVLATRVSVDET